MMVNQRVILLGLDGATFDLLLPMAERGDLPNLKRMLEQGAHGVLRSTLPPFTAPAWTSLASGKSPGRHGVVDFWRRSRPGGAKVPVSYKSIRTALLWDYLNGHGRTVGLVDVPLTYPPPSLEGYVVSGLMTPGRSVSYTSPDNLKAEVEEVVPGYDPDPYEAIPEAEFLQHTLEWIDKKERLVHYLFDRRPVDFFFNVVRAPDVIQHRFWDCLDATHPHYDASRASGHRAMLARCFRRIDEVIGDRMRRFDERTTLLVVSDHGFGAAYRYFHVNEFLREHGLLAVQDHSPGQFKRIARNFGITSEALALRLRRLDRFGLRSRLTNTARTRFRSMLDRQLTQPIDWENTGAWSGGITGEFIYLKPDVPESVRESLIAALKGLRDPGNGRPVFEHVYRKGEAWPGASADDLPDIILDVGAGPYILTDRLGASRIFQDLVPGDWVGRHRPEGVFLALGTGIRSGQTLPVHDLIDIAPTVLHLMGLPVPPDMDGQILYDLLADDFRKAPTEATQEAAPIPFINADALAYSQEDVSKISRRLKALGYLD